jgi:putative component of membrane protein insertase Oxa1/YidC/SpoIIIJ protein YidD
VRLQQVIAIFSAAISLTACSSPRLRNIEYSSTDAHYLQTSKVDSSGGAVSVRFYREGLRGVLYSHCRYFPSDSTFFLQTERRCGSMKASFLTLSRMLNEYDAAIIGIPLISEPSGVSLYAPPPDCS